MIFQIILLSLFAACILGAPTKVIPLEEQQPTVIPIVSQSEELESNGTYKFSYETGNGIKREEISYDKVIPKSASRSANSDESGESDDGNEIHVQRGSYSYTAPDGTVITIRYIADENGFQPFGSHLPRTPAPISISSTSNNKSGRVLKQQDNSESGSEQSPSIKLQSEKAISDIGTLLGNEPKSPKIVPLVASENSIESTTATVSKLEDESDISEARTTVSSQLGVEAAAASTSEQETKASNVSVSLQSVKNIKMAAATTTQATQSKIKPDDTEGMSTVTPQLEKNSETSEIDSSAKPKSEENFESSTQEVSEKKFDKTLSSLETTSVTFDENTTEPSSEGSTLTPTGEEESSSNEKSTVTTDEATGNAIDKTTPAATEVTTKSTQGVTEQTTFSEAPSSEDVSTSASSA